MNRRIPTPTEILARFHGAGVRLEPVTASVTGETDIDWLAGREPTEAEENLIATNAPGLVHALERLYLDFETTSLADLPDTGAAAYAAHPSMRVLILCWAVGMGTVRIWLPGSPCPSELRQAIEAGYTVVAHNTAFEAAVWQAHQVPAGWPAIADTQWSCTMARARAARYPASLKLLARRLGLRHQKDPAGEGLIRKAALAGRTGVSLPAAEQAAFVAYCRQDCEALRELDYRLSELSGQERAVWLLDARMNARGLPINIDGARHLDVVHQAENARLEAKMHALVALTPNQRDKLLAWLQANGAVGLPNMQQETLEAWLAVHGTPDGRLEDDTLPLTERVIRCRLEYAASAGSKLERALGATMPDGRIRGCFQWHGAHTGRWAGRIIQPQNLPRVPKDFDTEVELAALLNRLGGVGGGAGMSIKARLAASLRALIQAPEGKRLVVADFSQVEARVLCWLAGQESMLEVYRRHGDTYLATAQALGSDSRQFGKLLVLSAGFGAGGNRLYQVAPSYRVLLTAPEAAQAISRWRQANPRITAFWHAWQDLLVAAVERPSGTAWRYPRDGRETLLIAMRRSGEDALRVQLPSGRHLIYHQPRMIEREDQPGRFDLVYQQVKGKDWQEERGWHGSFVENVVQAIAYDLMADRMLRMDAAGIELIGTVHDEAIALAPCETASATLQEMRLIMSTPPDWANGLPLAAEGYHNVRYVKPRKLLTPTPESDTAPAPTPTSYRPPGSPIIAVAAQHPDWDVNQLAAHFNVPALRIERALRGRG